MKMKKVHLLEKSFEEENKLEPERKTQLAKKLGLQTRQVAVWFQNRRARWKNKQLEKDYDHLKSSFDFLKSDYDSVLKENEKLKAELMALVEKLRAEEVAVVEAISGGGVKTDHLSSGSVGSAIVDDGRQLMDSGDSYFMSGDYHTGCAAAPTVDGIGSEEDDGSDDGRNYFSDEIPVLVAVEEEEEEVAEQNGGETSWWVWS